MKQFSILLLCILLHGNTHIFGAQNTNNFPNLNKNFFNQTNQNTIGRQTAQVILSYKQYEEESRNIVYAVMTRNISGVTELLNQNINPDTRNYYYGGDYFRNNTLLHLAVKIGAFDIVKILLEKKANQEFEDNVSRTPLSWCIEKSKSEECPEKKQEYLKILDLLEEKK